MVTFEKVKTLKGEVEVPADKSITHRSFILSAMACGESVVKNPLMSRDTKATMAALKACGVQFEEIEDGFKVISKGYEHFNEPFDIINCENSGTTARLLTGLFSPMRKYFVLTGDNSLKKRPMGRVTEPLSKMGAVIFGRNNNKNLPITILPSEMRGIKIESTVKSAQVKSAIILAGLQIDGETVYVERVKTRNHTEVMLKYYGVDLEIDNDEIKVPGKQILKPSIVEVPGDFSSAAFFIGAALMFENSEILIKNVGLNPTRTGFIQVLKDLGADISITVRDDSFEVRGDIFVRHSGLKGGKVEGEIIPNIIDEIPLLGVLGLFCENPLEIRDAEELRVKESDRINSIVHNLNVVGAKIEEYNDGFKVYPIKNVNDGGVLKSFDDHRIAMINILLAKRFGNFLIDSIESIDVSFPDFIERFELLEV
ncbi:3-phosphoshikimate 1-carboxyvinyltransferase [Deferribacter autotrophicus]|uniref:3-phosphoshikimate 1-carboxyvinyltransferase n=1 Tax=Deferribacter autotrophicus TaxID=500465 RepID=A0A5A8F6Y5_9BACT|nr:3-phosphoshikimate 1-carboxyvinyltransferase [Deferribacter autotrophicus]KAA0257775.1 3-phosphoshikimate 1-carboxyvinyltransferase [Deferribacter autotrophicus]